MRTFYKPLGFALALGCAGIATQAQANDGTGNIKAAPSDALGAVHINVSRLRKAPLFKELIGAKEIQEALNEAKQQAGVDLQKDVDGVTILLPSSILAEPQPLVIINGSLDNAKLKKLFTEEIGGKEEGGLLVDGSGMGLFLDKGRAVAGPVEALKGIKAGTASNSALSGLVGGVDTGKDLWFAVSVPPMLAPMLAQVSPEASEIKSATGSLDLAGGGLALKATITMGKPEAAKAIADMANQQKGAANELGSGVGVNNLSDQLKISASGAAVKIDLSLSAADVSKIKSAVSSELGLSEGGSGNKAAAPAPAIGSKASKAVKPATGSKVSKVKKSKLKKKKKKKKKSKSKKD